ncbi:MAG: hypothetical protein JOY67_12305 [Hyphomicrobiales bacterium]|nr:hypothetical protein [Hyphomicrobiales bacterium]MBV9520467.1 hypothetical protein [Hyphomicrobiales bacterium]
MIRYVDELGLFLLPFALFFLFLALSGREVFAPEHWRGARGWLAIAGVALAIAGLVTETLRLERHDGVYRPAHMENGRLVPGSFDAPVAKP